MNEDQLSEEQIATLSYVPFEQQAALLGQPGKLQSLIKRAASPKSAIPSGLTATSRDEALRRFDALPHEIQKGLLAKRLQLSDVVFYVSKAVGVANEVRMFLNTDTKAPGVGNVAFQKLEKDNYFLPVGIQLLGGVNAILPATTFGLITPAVANGDFEFKANGKYLMPKDTSARIFDTANMNNQLVGYSRINNPKWIEPQVDIIFDIRFGAQAIANTNLQLALHGVVVLPY